jgi:hypothetical protein
MRLIRPVTITDTNFTYSNIPIDDDGYSEWASGTTYNTGDTVYYGNYLYESVGDSNTGNDPSTTSTGTTPDWLKLGMVNKWRMFDDYTNTVTTGPAPDVTTGESDIIVTLDEGNVEYVAFFNLDAVTILVEMLDATDTVVWSEELDLFADVEDVGDWYEYFFGDDTQPHTDAIIQLGWITYEEKVKITITNIGSESECGMCCIGRGRYLGATQYNPEVSILDYSRKSTDDFGRTFLAQGNFAKMIRSQVFVEEYAFDATRHYLQESRGLACAWDFNEEDTNYNGLLVYGFFQDFRLVIPGPNHAMCSLDIQGLI